MTQEQKKYLNNLRDNYSSIINSISYDFVDERALSDSGYISDSFTEYADSATSIYYSDQHNYFVNHSKECENALLEYMDPNSIACDIYLTEEQIEEIASNDFDYWDDYAHQVNETIKEE